MCIHSVVVQAKCRRQGPVGCACCFEFTSTCPLARCEAPAHAFHEHTPHTLIMVLDICPEFAGAHWKCPLERPSKQLAECLISRELELIKGCLRSSVACLLFTGSMSSFGVQSFVGRQVLCRMVKHTGARSYYKPSAERCKG